MSVAAAVYTTIHAAGELIDCPECHGRGWTKRGEDRARKCVDCEGTGRRPVADVARGIQPRNEGANR